MKSIEKHINTSFILKFVIFLTFFLLPTHWFWHFSPSWAYWSGIRMEPWIPKVFVSTLFVFLLWIVTSVEFLIGHEKKRPRDFAKIGRSVQKWVFANWKPLVVASIFLSVNIGFSLVPQVSLVFWIQVFTGPALLLAWIILYEKSYSQWIWSGVFAGISWQIFLGWWQYLVQESLGGYWFTGQPDFKSIFIVTSEFYGSIVKLPYGSTPHPNVLAAWVVFGILICWKKMSDIPSILKIIWSIAAFLTVFWTESLAAWATLLILGVWFTPAIQQKWKNLLFWPGIILLLVASTFGIVWADTISQQRYTSLSRRAVMIQSVPRLMLEKPLGWGALQHPLGYTPRENRELQTLARHPVHSAGIAWLLDTGVWTILLLFTFFNIVQIKYSLKILIFLLSIPIFSLDHFGYSTIGGQFLFILFYYFVSNDFTLKRPRTIDLLRKNKRRNISNSKRNEARILQ